jgi:hypothetical protein
MSSSSKIAEDEATAALVLEGTRASVETGIRESAILQRALSSVS